MNNIYNVWPVSIICTCQNLETTYSIMFTFIGSPQCTLQSVQYSNIYANSYI